MKAVKASKKRIKAYAFILAETGLTIKDIASYLCCNPVALGQVMKGKKKASAMFFAALDRALCIYDEVIKVRFHIDTDKIKKKIDVLRSAACSSPEENKKKQAEIEVLQRMLYLVENRGKEEVDKEIKASIDMLATAGEEQVKKAMEDYSPRSFFLGVEGLEKCCFMHYLQTRGIWEYRRKPAPCG